MINNEWPLRRIGDLFEIAAGQMMNAASRDSGATTPFLRTSNVLWDEVDIGDVDEMVIAESALAQKTLRAGDLLVCEGGEIGRAAVWNGEREVMSFQNHVHRLRTRVDELEPRFYVYFLQSAFTQMGIFAGAGNKTTIPNLSRGRLAQLEVPVPPIEEARAVVATLAHVRTAQRENLRSEELASELKRTAMRALFSRGLRGEAQRESEIGLVPESWSVEEFSGIRQRLQYGTSVRCTNRPSAFPVLRIPNIEMGRINSTELKYADILSSESDRYLLNRGDLLFIRTNGVLDRLGNCAVYDGEPVGALFASYLIRAELRLDRVDPKFIAYFLGSEVGTALVASRATPAADGKYNLNTGTIDGIPVPVPPSLEEQAEIVALVGALDAKIRLHRRKREVLDELFKSLLQKLMTGEIRVADLNLDALDDLPATKGATS